jgi:hypothetical protein
VQFRQQIRVKVGTGQVTDGSNPFAAAGGGNCYLADNTFRDAGTANLDPALLADIQTKTTYPPASLAGDFAASTTLYPCVPRDTATAPDLGYHYDPVDYLGDSLTVESGATLKLTNGAVVGVNGNNVTVNGTLVADQTVAGAQVQEAQAAPLGIYIGGNEAAAYTDTDGDGLPDWWEAMYFGNLNQAATNMDASGNTLLYDYQNGIYPNVINFTVWLGNEHFNTTNATGTFLVLGGVPSYEAVLVNDTNFNDAVWTNYDGNVRMNLGSTDSVYQVSLGLKGFDTNDPAIWIGTTVYLDRVAPRVIITNPTNGTVAVPYIQLQGCSPEELDGITFDVSNALAVVTNQPGQLLGRQFFDTNTFDKTATNSKA